MSHPLLITHPLLVTLVAEGPKNTGPDFGKASPVGLFVIVLLLIGVFALVWSMNRHLKRLPESFEAPATADSSVLSAEGRADSVPPTDGGKPAPSGEHSGESGG